VQSSVPTIAGDNFLPERYEMVVDQAPAAGVADGGDWPRSRKIAEFGTYSAGIVWNAEPASSGRVTSTAWPALAGH
jgi:hypothetical protein